MCRNIVDHFYSGFRPRKPIKYIGLVVLIYYICYLKIYTEQVQCNCCANFLFQ